MAKSRRGLKICCAVTALLLIMIVITMVTLYFTLFKPKQPKITTRDVTLDQFKANLFDWTDVNVTLGITVRIENPNYGGFEYGNSTAYVTYHGELVAESPIPEDSIPARGTHDISTTVFVIGRSLVKNPNFPVDSITRVYNFTSTTTIKGKATVLKKFKKKATAYTICDISVSFGNQYTTSVCKSNVKF